MSFFKNLFGLDRVTPQSDAASAYLTTVYGNEQLCPLQALLRGNGIPYRTCERGAGSVARVIAGFNMYGTDVFVHPDDLDRAQELLAADAEDADGQSSSEDDGQV